MNAKVVLLVEDEALILLDIEAALVDEGFDVVPAINGAKAMEAFDADPSGIDAVVTDINLGKGPNGWDLANHIRAHQSEIPVVYMSGDSSHEWSAKGVPESTMIPKPFVHAQVITALSTLMNHSDQA